MALQEALEEDDKKDTPSFGKEDLEEIHRSGTEAGLLGMYNFPGSVYATDGSNDKGVMHRVLRSTGGFVATSSDFVPKAYPSLGE